MAPDTGAVVARLRPARELAGMAAVIGAIALGSLVMAIREGFPGAALFILIAAVFAPVAVLAGAPG